MSYGELDFLVILTGCISPNMRLLGLNWSIYDIINKKVKEEADVFLSPVGENISNMFSDTRLTDETGLTPQDFEKSVEIKEALQNFNKAVYENIILENSTFCLVTLDEELLCRILPAETTKAGIKLAPHFSKYFELKSDFTKCYPNAQPVSFLSEMLNFLNLKDTMERIRSKYECRTMVRIINRMIKDNHKFKDPKDVMVESIKLANPAPTIQIYPNLETISPSSNSSPSASATFPTSTTVLAIRGAPFDASESELEEFLYGIKVDRIVPMLDQYAQRTGCFYVHCLTEEDAQEALCYTKRLLRNRVISIEESSEKDLAIATRTNEFVQKLQGRGKFYRVIGGYYEGIEGAVYSLPPDTFLVLPQSASPPDHLHLAPTDEQEFLIHLRPNIVNRSKVFTTEQKLRAVKLKGFPMKISKQEVADFLIDFEVKKGDTFLQQDSLDRAMIEAIVILNTPDERDRLIRTMSHRQYRGRFIEVYPYS